MLAADGALLKPGFDCGVTRGIPAAPALLLAGRDFDPGAAATPVEAAAAVLVFVAWRFFFFGGRPRLFFPTLDLTGVSDSAGSFAATGAGFFLGGLPRLFFTTGVLSSSSVSFLGGLPRLFGNTGMSLRAGGACLGGLPLRFGSALG